MSAVKTIDWAKLRADFPILNQNVHGKPLVYFDNAATSQKPRAVIQALVHYYEHDNANVHRGIHELSNRSTNAFEAARACCTAKFINHRKAPKRNYFSRVARPKASTSSPPVRVGRTKILKPGDVILLTEMEHHSNLVPWQMLAKRTGARIVYIPVTGDEGLLDLSKVDSLLTPAVKFFSMVHISNSLGTVNPVADLCARARQTWHRHARGRRSKCRSSARRCPGHWLRLLRVLRPQDLRTDRHRCSLGTAGTARCDAALPGRRRNDPLRRLRQDRVQTGAASVRSGHAGYFRSHRPARRDGLSRCHRPRKHRETRPGTRQLRLRKRLVRVKRHPYLRPRKQIP